MKSIIVKAPAKVNLYLDVINKRPDGYHNIETIFEKIDLCDWVKVSIIQKGISIICDKDLPGGSGNIAYKAASILSKTYNLKCGFKIEIDKRIPQGAGLGGGSSDAAATLLAINDLLNIRLSNTILTDCAAKIGADVPFFVSGYNRAFGSGIGDKLLPIKQKQKLHFLLVAPSVKIATGSVYRNLNLPLTKTRRNATIVHPYLRNSDNSINNTIYNKLEEVVLPSYPVLYRIKKVLLKAGAEGVLVSGSGSAVYGIFQSRKEAVRAESKLSKKGNWQLFLTSSH